MKKLFLSLLVSAFTYAGTQAQTKKMEEKTIQTISFRDNKTKDLKGILVSELIEKSAISGNEKKYKYIYQRKDSLVTFYIYQEWHKPASGFDEFKEYTFHTNILQNDDAFVIDENEADENISSKYYSLSLRTINDKAFKINTYNRYQSTPDRTSTFSVFNIKSLNKENLQKVLDELKSMIPKPKTDDE